MSYFRLLDKRCVEKALESLFSSLTPEQLKQDYPALVADYAKSQAKMDLEGFTLFSPGARTKPADWFSLKTSVSVGEVLRMYEHIALQPVTHIDSAGEIASHLFAKTSDNRRTLAKLKAPGHWLSAALMFAATVQKWGEIEKVTHNSVRMRIGNGLIDVSPDGCWSNSKRMVIPPTCAPNDINGNPITTFPSARTNNPNLKALYHLADGNPTQYAVTLLAHALDHEVVSKAYVTNIVRPGKELAVKVIDLDAQRRADAKIALSQCDELLTVGGVEIVEHLFDVAVPKLMAYSRLQAIVGAPTQIQFGRRIKPATLANWRRKIHAEAARTMAR